MSGRDLPFRFQLSAFPISAFAPDLPFSLLATPKPREGGSSSGLSEPRNWCNQGFQLQDLGCRWGDGWFASGSICTGIRLLLTRDSSCSSVHTGSHCSQRNRPPLSAQCHGSSHCHAEARAKAGLLCPFQLFIIFPLRPVVSGP